MANCKECGIKMVTLEHTQWNGYCKNCKERTDAEPPFYQAREIKKPNIYSIWNTSTAGGFIFIAVSFFSGEILLAISFQGTVFQQIALSLSFGFFGIALVMLGIARTFLKVITANNEKDKS